MAVATVSRYLKVQTEKGKVRLASYQDREHVVVPVVAIKEGVVRASNSDQWEYVPKKLIEDYPYQWNGRPVLPDHPSKEKLANEPGILEQNQFGTLFNSRSSDGKLLTEAWLDPARADIVGDVAKSVIRRARAGESIEVSIGAAVHVEQISGVFNGKPYDGTWTDMRGDHLAMLDEGKRGACNNDMGCGAPRTMEEAVADEKKTLSERLKDFLSPRKNISPEEMSDQDLRRALNDVLHSSEPGFIGVESVFPDKGEVIYATMPEDKFLLFRRSYTMSKKGEVSLKEKKEQVEPVMKFETVGAEAPAPCGCADKGEEAMKTKKERVAALIANPRLKLQPTHAATLEASSDEVLDSLESAVKIVEDKEAAEAAETKRKADEAAAALEVKRKADEAAAQTTRAASEAKPKTLDEFVNEAPAELREILKDSVRIASENKKVIVKQLTDSGRCDYTAAELEAMSMSALQKLSKLADIKVAAPVVDFSGRGMQQPTETRNNEEKAPAPPDMYAQIRTASSGTTH
jgi:hypothetical protein